MKRLLPGLVAIVLLGLVYLGVTPALSKPQGTWQRVEQAAPTKLLQQLRQDYAPYLRSDTPVDVGQMQMLKLQQPNSLPLYLINTRVHPKGQPEQTPTCGIGGCLFLGYLPDRDGFKPVLNRWINDFRVQGTPPVVQPTGRVLNGVPCFQLTPYNSRTQKPDPTQILCFNGKDFVPAGEESKQKFNPRGIER